MCGKSGSMISVDIGSEITIKIEVNKIDFDNTKPLLEKVGALVLDHKKNIVINMERVVYIDSAGIAMLVQLIQLYSGTKRNIEFKNITRSVRTTLKLVNLSKFFNLI